VPALLVALDDPDRFAAAHLLLERTLRCPAPGRLRRGTPVPGVGSWVRTIGTAKQTEASRPESATGLKRVRLREKRSIAAPTAATDNGAVPDERANDTHKAVGYRRCGKGLRERTANAACNAMM
jgi:hypothetical protein